MGSYGHMLLIYNSNHLEYYHKSQFIFLVLHVKRFLVSQIHKILLCNLLLIRCCYIDLYNAILYYYIVMNKYENQSCLFNSPSFSAKTQASFPTFSRLLGAFPRPRPPPANSAHRPRSQHSTQPANSGPNFQPLGSSMKVIQAHTKY